MTEMRLHEALKLGASGTVLGLELPGPNPII